MLLVVKRHYSDSRLQTLPKLSFKIISEIFSTATLHSFVTPLKFSHEINSPVKKSRALDFSFLVLRAPPWLENCKNLQALELLPRFQPRLRTEPTQWSEIPRVISKPFFTDVYYCNLFCPAVVAISGGLVYRFVFLLN